MRLRNVLLPAVLMTTAPSLAHAHFLWAYIDSTKHVAKLEIAESPGESIAPILGKFASKIQGSSGPWHLTTDLQFLMAPLTTNAFSTSLEYGLHGSDWVTWWARGCKDINSATKSSGQAYELTVRRTKRILTAIVRRNGKAVPNAQIEVYCSGKEIGSKLKSDATGMVSFSAPAHGVLAVGAIVTEPNSGKIRGAAYKQKMHLVSITVERLD